MNTGLKLEYVPSIKGDECLMVENNNEDICSEIEYWKNAIVCYVIGAHPPFNVLNG